MRQCRIILGESNLFYLYVPNCLTNFVCIAVNTIVNKCCLNWPVSQHAWRFHTRVRQLNTYQWTQKLWGALYWSRGNCICPREWVVNCLSPSFSHPSKQKDNLLPFMPVPCQCQMLFFNQDKNLGPLFQIKPGPGLALSWLNYLSPEVLEVFRKPATWFVSNGKDFSWCGCSGCSVVLLPFTVLAVLTVICARRNVYVSILSQCSVSEYKLSPVASHWMWENWIWPTTISRRLRYCYLFISSYRLF